MLDPPPDSSSHLFHDDTLRHPIVNLQGNTAYANAAANVPFSKPKTERVFLEEIGFLVPHSSICGLQDIWDDGDYGNPAFVRLPNDNAYLGSHAGMSGSMLNDNKPGLSAIDWQEGVRAKVDSQYPLLQPEEHGALISGLTSLRPLQTNDQVGDTDWQEHGNNAIDQQHPPLKPEQDGPLIPGLTLPRPSQISTRNRDIIMVDADDWLNAHTLLAEQNGPLIPGLTLLRPTQVVLKCKDVIMAEATDWLDTHVLYATPVRDLRARGHQ
jgi:hypothetical protein